MAEQGFTPPTSEWYRPAADMIKQANVPDYDAVYELARQDPQAFWARSALMNSNGTRNGTRFLMTATSPSISGSSAAKPIWRSTRSIVTSTTWRRNKLAIIWEGEHGEKTTLSYWRLWQETNKFANVLRGMGVKKGDRVTIYMGRVPEIAIAMLACAKIGAPHSVVYGGFSEQALASRIDDAQSKVVITCDGAWLRGKIVPLKDTVDEAVMRSPVVETVIVVKRTNHEINMEAGRDYWYHDLMALPFAKPNAETEVMDAEDPLFILYTSGTTGKPKGVLHTHGGYQVYTSTTLEWAFDIKEEDRWWCAADPGWITGHSYIVYAPLILGATSIIYEGAPTFPYPDRWWQIVAEYGVTILYTAPTAIRGLMRFGEAWPARQDLSSLRLLGTVGEPINPEAWRWYHRVIGAERCPIIDTWWQTETGGFMITPLPSVGLKPGSATRPFPGIEVDIVDEDGAPVGDNEDGNLVIKGPWPSMIRTVYGDDERFISQYWEKYRDQGWYLAGDTARRDEDGYLWVIGRNDDVLKVSGYRLGTAEVESGSGQPQRRGRVGGDWRARRVAWQQNLRLLHPGGRRRWLRCARGGAQGARPP